jgi:hypothetical protein
MCIPLYGRRSQPKENRRVKKKKGKSKKKKEIVIPCLPYSQSGDVHKFAEQQCFFLSPFSSKREV